MEILTWVSVLTLLCSLEAVVGKNVYMWSNCLSSHPNNIIKLEDDEKAYVEIDGSNWWNSRSCEIIFKADGAFDDLQLTFTQYMMNDCDASIEIWTAMTNSFYGSTDSRYSCSNAPLTNWKFAKNRYIKLKVSRDHESTRDFHIKLEIEVQDYDQAFDSATTSIGLAFATIIGIVVAVIVLAVIVVVVIVCCCCMKSKRSSGTVYRQNYQAAPVVTATTTTAPPQNWPQQPGVQPSAPYPTLPGYTQQPPFQQAGANYPYGYGYPQGGPVPPTYPAPHHPGGYPPQLPGYQQVPDPSGNIEPSAPPAMNEPPPPYPGMESVPLKGGY